MKPIFDALTEIADRHLNIPTLQARRSDSLDFHEVGVWAVKNALWAAHEAGVNASAGNTAALEQDVRRQMRTALQMASNYMADDLDETDETEMRVFDAIRTAIAKATADSPPSGPAAAALLAACQRAYHVFENDTPRKCEVMELIANAIAQATGETPPSTGRTLTIEVRGGVVEDVSNVPPGWDYEIIDHDIAE